MRPKTRSRTSGQRTPRSSASTPSFADAAGVAARSAVCTNIFVGMQPTFRQVPPNTPRSTIATRQPAKRSSRTELPEPVPTMTRSKCVTYPSNIAGAGRCSSVLICGRDDRAGERVERQVETHDRGSRFLAAPQGAPVARVHDEVVPVALAALRRRGPAVGPGAEVVLGVERVAGQEAV